jgi:hypothetical protein
MTWLDAVTLETVIVHTRDGMSLKGLKSSVYDDSIVLKEARVLEAEGLSSLINGEVVIPREQVHFIQIVSDV